VARSRSATVPPPPRPPGGITPRQFNGRFEVVYPSDPRHHVWREWYARRLQPLRRFVPSSRRKHDRFPKSGTGSSRARTCNYGDAPGTDVPLVGYEADGVSYTFQHGLPCATREDGTPPQVEILAWAPTIFEEDDHGYADGPSSPVTATWPTSPRPSWGPTTSKPALERDTDVQPYLAGEGCRCSLRRWIHRVA
jgi:hypothetical protein